jgi:hypothetical protein
MRRRTLVACPLLTAAAILISPVAASAAADTTTVHVNEARSVPGYVNPCTGAVGTINEAFRSVTHVTDLSGGGYHETTTVTSSFTFVPDDPSQPGYYGEYTVWDGENLTPQNQYTATETAHFTAFGTDGSRATEHVTVHVTLDPDGNVIVTFDDIRLTCP